MITQGSSESIDPPVITCVNGYYPENSTICICYEGWETEENVTNLEKIEKCNKQIESSNSSSTVVEGYSKISLILSIAIPCLIILVFTIYFLSCIRKKCKSKKKRNCSREKESNNSISRKQRIRVSDEESQRNERYQFPSDLSDFNFPYSNYTDYKNKKDFVYETPIKNSNFFHYVPKTVIHSKLENNEIIEKRVPKTSPKINHRPFFMYHKIRYPHYVYLSNNKTEPGKRESGKDVYLHPKNLFETVFID